MARKVGAGPGARSRLGRLEPVSGEGASHPWTPGETARPPSARDARARHSRSERLGSKLLQEVHLRTRWPSSANGTMDIDGGLLGWKQTG